MSIVIAGIGVSVPPHRQAQEETAEIAHQFACKNEDQSRLLNGIYRGAGVDTRHSVLLETTEEDPHPRQSFYGESSPTTRARMRRYEAEAIGLAYSAARNAIEDAAVSPDRVTHVVTVSCSGFFAPGVDIALIKRLGLSRKVARTHVGFMGCHGMLNGLRVAGAFLEQDPEACVLLLALEMCSLHHQYGWDVGQIVANALFADGAAAVVAVGGEPRSPSDLRVAASGSVVVDDSEDAMSWRIGDHGFLMTLSQRIPELIAKNIRAYLEEWLSSHGLDLDRVGSWAVHPGGPRILTAFSQATGVYGSRLQVSYDILAEFGNMSSPTVFFIIDRMRQLKAPRPDRRPGFWARTGGGVGAFGVNRRVRRQGSACPSSSGPNLSLGRGLDDDVIRHASGARLKSLRMSARTSSAGRPRPACMSSKPWRMPSSVRASSASSRARSNRTASVIASFSDEN